MRWSLGHIDIYFDFTWKSRDRYSDHVSHLSRLPEGSRPAEGTKPIMGFADVVNKVRNHVYSSAQLADEAYVDSLADVQTDATAASGEQVSTPTCARTARPQVRHGINSATRTKAKACLLW